MTARCCKPSERCSRTSGLCANGWTRSTSAVPSPWTALAARGDLNLLRATIAEPGRYYDAPRVIVIRKGLLLEQERRYLWHELVHADRRDTAGHGHPGVEAAVEREAARRAMPLASLRWAFGQEYERWRIAEMLKLPEPWIQFRLDIATDQERRQLRDLQDGLLGERVA